MDWITHTIVIPDDESSSSEKVQGKFSVTSETIEEVTIEIEDDDNSEKVTTEKKRRSLKRKFIPSRKSPRIKILKLDMQAGVKTALDKKKKTLVESLAKGIVSKIKPQQTQGLPTDKSKGDQPSSSSTSSQSSLKQKTILQMYAQAAQQIPQNSKNKPVPAPHPVSQRKSASQGSAGDFPPPPPPPHWITQSQPPPGQIS